MTSQPNHTPAWGTPVNPAGNAAETTIMPAASQLTPPVSQVVPQQPRPTGPTKAEVELRVTALHYADKLVGPRGTTITSAHKADVLSVARDLETYLLTGQIA